MPAVVIGRPSNSRNKPINATELVEFEALQPPINEIHLPVELQVFLLGPVNDRSVIEGAKADRTFRLWHQCTINIARDRGVEHTTAMCIGVRRDIRAAP